MGYLIYREEEMWAVRCKSGVFDPRAVKKFYTMKDAIDYVDSITQPPSLPRSGPYGL